MDSFLTSLSDEQREGLTEGHLTNPTLARYKTIPDLLDGLIEKQARLGHSVTIPKEGADEQALKDFYKSLETGAPNLTPSLGISDEQDAEFWRRAGVPGDDGYSHEAEGSPMDEEGVKVMREVAQEAGLTQKQFNALVIGMGTRTGAHNATVTEGIDADKAIVSDRWGLAAEHKKNAIQALISQFQDDEHPVGDLNAAGWLMMNNIVKQFSGKPQANGLIGDGPVIPTPGEIDSQLSDIRTELMDGQLLPAKRNSLLTRMQHLQEQKQKSTMRAA